MTCRDQDDVLVETKPACLGLVGTKGCLCGQELVYHLESDPLLCINGHYLVIPSQREIKPLMLFCSTLRHQSRQVWFQQSCVKMPIHMKILSLLSNMPSTLHGDHYLVITHHMRKIMQVLSKYYLFIAKSSKFYFNKFNLT